MDSSQCCAKAFRGLIAGVTLGFIDGDRRALWDNGSRRVFGYVWSGIPANQCIA